MPAATSIQYLRQHEIDKTAWDACIEKAENGLIYARSFYLDAMCDHWDALVLNNYEAVMPLPWRRKWGVRYVYQVPFVQRLGIFGSAVTQLLSLQFITAATQHFRYIHYHIDQPLTAPFAATHACQNYIINLTIPYSDIYNKYTAECKKNIRKAGKQPILFTQPTTADVVGLYKKIYGPLHPHLSNTAYDRFEHALQMALQQHLAKLYSITLHGACLLQAALLIDHKRIYYVMGAPTALGRKYRVTYYFIDAILQQHQGQPLYFDFEGSDIPNVAHFYQKFGPEAETYFEININQLPLPWRLLK